jgi:hypothetical protein
MTDETSKTPAGRDDGAPSKQLTPAARRALAEAEARRQDYRQKEAALPREIGGRGGKEPGRYGDWEVKGLTSDF